MLGTELDELVELEVVLDEDDELPHAATNAPTPTASTTPRIHLTFTTAPSSPLLFCNTILSPVGAPAPPAYARKPGSLCPLALTEHQSPGARS